MKNLPSIVGEAELAIKIAVEEKHPISNLEQLGVGQRLINLLHSNQIFDMEDLMFKTKQDLMKITNFGERQLYVLFESLSKYHTIQVQD